MKKSIITPILALLITAGTAIQAQDQPAEYLGLPGDNLNLYAVMNLFQESKTLEDFERDLNDPNTKINNLDLNGDNLVDYITVTDIVDDNVHTIVMQVALTRYEKQDVAVFTVQRFNNESVQIQLIGDEELYGKNYIIEPIYDDNDKVTPNPGYTGNVNNVTVIRTTTYEVAAWPMVRFIYNPGYTVWRSSWYWGYYPSYWHPWNPFYYHYYYGYHHNWYPEYYRHYRHWEHPRYTRYDDFYYRNHRSTSVQVNVRIKNGNYKTTYSHPEQRRDGEALYSNTHSDRRSATTTNTSRRSTNVGNDNSRTNRSSGQNTATSRRSNTNVSGQGSTNRSSGQNNSNVRRSGTNATDQGIKTRSSNQNTGTTNRSNSSVNNQNNRSQSSGQNTEVSRRSSTSAPARSTAKPESSHRETTSNTSSRSTKSVSTTTTRTRTESKKEPAARSSDKSTKSSSKESTRRK